MGTNLGLAGNRCRLAGKSRRDPLVPPHEHRRVAHGSRGGGSAQSAARRAQRWSRPCRPPPRLSFPRPEGAGGRSRMRMRPAPGRRRRASVRSTTLSHRGMSGAIPHKRGCAPRRVQAQAPSPSSAAGGPATYPMVRRADPRVGRACARATQGAPRERPCLPFRALGVSSLGPRGTGGRTAIGRDLPLEEDA